MMEQPPAKKTSPPLTGDATSKLLQFMVREVGAKFTPSGNGSQDIRRLATELHNAQQTANILWQMGQDLAHAIDNADPPVPDAFKAIVVAGILRANANIENAKK
jgi:hypothetical protein